MGQGQALGLAHGTSEKPCPQHPQTDGPSLQTQVSAAPQVGVCARRSGPGSAGAEDIQDASQTRGQATRTFQMAREHMHPGIVPEEPDRKLSRRLPPQDLPMQPVSCPAPSRPQCLLSACGCQPHAGTPNGAKALPRASRQPRTARIGRRA